MEISSNHFQRGFQGRLLEAGAVEKLAELLKADDGLERDPQTMDWCFEENGSRKERGTAVITLLLHVITIYSSHTEFRWVLFVDHCWNMIILCQYMHCMST